MENNNPIEIVLEAANGYSGKSINHHLANVTFSITFNIDKKLLKELSKKKVTFEDLKGLVEGRL